MTSSDERAGDAARNGERIADSRVRRLYDILCGEIVRFSPSVTVEAAPFETRFATSSGLQVRISPYREIFLVSCGLESPLDIRVSDEEGLLRALDIVLESYLSSHASVG